MSEPLAYLNGRFIPASQAVVPVTDAGFMQGVTVAEQIRTFGGRLFRLNEHLSRLERSLEMVGVDSPMSQSQLSQAAGELSAQNHALLSEGDDLGLCIFVTPGPYRSFDLSASPRPTVMMHSYPLPFQLSAQFYQRGQTLIVTDVRQVPPQCWSPQLKCRSRMHYYLADQQAQIRQTGARALLTDADGFVTEASTANLVIYRADEGLISPPLEKILPGISLAVLAELAAAMQLRLSYRDLTPSDVVSADEVFLTSTSTCLLAAVQLDGRDIGGGGPGQLFSRLLAAWSDLVGLEIAAQATRFCRR